VLEDELLRRFVVGGFERLTGDELLALSERLEETTSATGEAAPLVLSEAIKAVYALFREHDEHGGVSLDFIRYLDKLAVLQLPKICASEPPEAARLARDFRDELYALVSEYDPAKPFGLG